MVLVISEGGLEVGSPPAVEDAGLGLVSPGPEGDETPVDGPVLDEVGDTPVDKDPELETPALEVDRMSLESELELGTLEVQVVLLQLWGLVDKRTLLLASELEETPAVEETPLETGLELGRLVVQVVLLQLCVCGLVDS